MNPIARAASAIAGLLASALWAANAASAGPPPEVRDQPLVIAQRAPDAAPAEVEEESDEGGKDEHKKKKPQRGKKGPEDQDGEPQGGAAGTPDPEGGQQQEGVEGGAGPPDQHGEQNQRKGPPFEADFKKQTDVPPAEPQEGSEPPKAEDLKKQEEEGGGRTGQGQPLVAPEASTEDEKKLKSKIKRLRGKKLPPPVEEAAPKTEKPAQPPKVGVPPVLGGATPAGKQEQTLEKKEERAARHKKKFEDLKKQRREVVEEGGKRVIIEEPDKRRIIRQDGRAVIHHDETQRFRKLYRDTRSERRADGTTVTIAVGPGGIQIFTELDGDGRPLRRYRRGRDGREIVLFDNRPFYRRAGQRRGFFDAYVELAPPIISIPRERYIVDYDRASDDDIYEALSAPPVDRIDRPYSLEEIRQSRYLRERMRRLDLDSITFDFGSWEVEPDEYDRLERVARIMNRILARNPDEMFMIEGYTDAVGSEEDNLTLSDRRAESVAEVLTEAFEVPPENLITQGYGEQFLKIETQAPERANRLVVVRRITPLLAR